MTYNILLILRTIFKITHWNTFKKELSNSVETQNHMLCIMTERTDGPLSAEGTLTEGD